MQMHGTHDQSGLSAPELLGKYLSQPLVLVSSLAVVTLVVYSGTLSFDFVWDDGPQIVNNPIIRTWHNFPLVFGTDLWYHVARHQVYYRPLFVVWSMLNYALFGLHPWGWHLGAIILHIAAVATMFWLGRQLRLGYWTAALAALIFALHPIHIESVAWISAASDAMVAMFVVLAFAAFLKTREPQKRNRMRWWISSIALLFCALLTKEMAVTFSALVGIYVFLRQPNANTPVWQKMQEAAKAAVPYAAVTLAYILLREHVLLHATGQFDMGHGTVDMIRTLPMVLVFYLKKLVFPFGLTGLYYTPYVTGAILKNVLFPTILLIAVTTTVWYWSRRQHDPTILFAGWWVLVTMAPALYLRNFGNGDFVRDRYVYLASIGFAILIAKALRHLPRIRNWSAKAVQACAVAVLCLFYAGASIAQQTFWANNFLVALRGQQLYSENPYTMVLLSAEYSQRGAYDRAIELAQNAVREHPEYIYGMLALAEANIRAGHFEEGRKALDRFVSVSPEFEQSETGMASLAGLYGRMGDLDRATGFCDKVLAKEPNLYSALYNCGNIQLMAGKYTVAEQLLSHAVSLEPLEAAPKHYLGRALLQDGRNQEAQALLQAAVAIDPKVWDYHYWLAKSLEQSGNISAARAEYQHALQLNQDSNDVKLRLATLEGR
jgi:tetratricopeptide (TPR) repeat protein